MIWQWACIFNVREIQMLSLWKGMKRMYFVFWSDRRLFLFEAMSDSVVWKGETYTRFYCITLLLAIFSCLCFTKLVLCLCWWMKLILGLCLLYADRHPGYAAVLCVMFIGKGVYVLQAYQRCILSRELRFGLWSDRLENLFSILEYFSGFGLKLDSLDGPFLFIYLCLK